MHHAKQLHGKTFNLANLGLQSENIGSNNVGGKKDGMVIGPSNLDCISHPGSP